MAAAPIPFAIGFVGIAVVISLAVAWSYRKRADRRLLDHGDRPGRTAAEENSDALIGLMAEKDSAAKQQEEVEKQYFTLRGEIDLKEKQLREMQRNQQLGNDLMMQMQNTINETKLKLVAVLERLSAQSQVIYFASKTFPAGKIRGRKTCLGQPMRHAGCVHRP